jgi:hypothetical protein
MAIPINITKQHILSAMEEVDKSGVPNARKSKKYYVHNDGKKYPPKYIISRANFYANRIELHWDPKIFQTYMAQDYLNEKGFKTSPQRRK